MMRPLFDLQRPLYELASGPIPWTWEVLKGSQEQRGRRD